MITGPCLNCPERTLGCHATCLAYNTYKKEHLEETRKIFDQKVTDNMMINYAKKKGKRLARRNK